MKRIMLIAAAIMLVAGSAMATDNDAVKKDKPRAEITQTQTAPIVIKILPGFGPMGPIIVVQRGGDDPEPERKTWSDIKRMFT